MRSVAALLACLLASFALAQPEVRQIFTDQSLDEALAESIRTHRVLIVYPRGQGAAFDLMDDTTWKNPTLWAWVKWHAIAVKVDLREAPGAFTRLAHAVPSMMPRDAGGGQFPVVTFFINGKMAGQYPDPRQQGYLYGGGLALPGGPPDPAVFYPKAVQLLFNLDILMERYKSLEPAWSMFHEHDNPEPQPPELTLLCSRADDDAPAVADPGAGEDALLYLDRARTHAKAKEYYDATGFYSWLYERGPIMEPALRPAASSFLLQEMADLAQRRDGSKHRFLAIRAEREARQPWWSFCDTLEWMTLGEALHQEDQTLTYIAAYTIDDQEATMIPPADRAAFGMLSRRDPFSDPRAVSAKAIDRLRAAAEREHKDSPPTGVPAEEWAQVTALRTRLFVDEACRVYAALSLRRDEARAREAAAILLGAHDDGPTRLMLVMTAAIAGAPDREDHARWVREAAAMGATSQSLMRVYPIQPGAAPATGSQGGR